MTTPGPNALQSGRACVFALAGERFAADIRHTREVVVLPERTAVPRAPAHILGVANLRGNVVPIVDIGFALGLPPRPASETLRNIVLEDAGIQIAVPTDEVLGLELVDDIRPMAASHYGELAVGLLRRSDGTVATLLDIPRLIDAARVASPTMREKEAP